MTRRMAVHSFSHYFSTGPDQVSFTACILLYFWLGAQPLMPEPTVHILTHTPHMYSAPRGMGTQ